MSTAVFGTAIWLRTRAGARVAVTISPRMIWDEGRLRVTKLGAAFTRWACPTCRGERVWWSVSHAPVCATCTPMPASIFESAWLEALNFCTGLIKTNGIEDSAMKAAIAETLDSAIVSGDLTRLLRLGMIHHMMELANKGKE